MQSNLMIKLFPPPPPPLLPALAPKGIISLSNVLSFADTQFMLFQASECASFRKSALANYTSFCCQARKKPIKKILMFKAGILKT